MPDSSCPTDLFLDISKLQRVVYLTFIQMLEIELTTLRSVLEALCKKGEEIKSQSNDQAALKAIDKYMNNLSSRMKDLDAQAKDKGQQIQVKLYLHSSKENNSDCV